MSRASSSRGQRPRRLKIVGFTHDSVCWHVEFVLFSVKLSSGVTQTVAAVLSGSSSGPLTPLPHLYLLCVVVVPVCAFLTIQLRISSSIGQHEAAHGSVDGWPLDLCCARSR